MLFLSVLLFAATPAEAALPAGLNKVFAYECESTFVEGEGAAQEFVNCPPFQQLGLLKARFHYYNFSGPQGSNEEKRIGDWYSSEPVCGFDLLQHRCTEKLPELKFGLAAAQDETYSVPVALKPAPGQQAETVGYAAPAVKGKCPEGLQLMQSLRTNPKSVTKPLPSNFVNTNGRLDDWIMMAPAKKLPRFEILRERNLDACDEAGDCSSVRFDTAVGFQRFDYKAASSVCVVPASAL